jgi:hypothetical protein
MDCIIRIIYLLFADLFEVLPLFFLMRGHDMSFWRFIEFSLCYIVNETRITCFFANVYSPHLEILTTWRISILALLCCKILSKNKVFLIRKFYWCSKHSFCSFSNKHMNCCFSSCYYAVAIFLNLFLKLRSLRSLRNIGCT